MRHLILVLSFFSLLFTSQAFGLVVYSGRSESMVGPLLKQFQEETGIKVDVRYNKSPELTTQLLAEGKDSPADVVFLQEAGYLSLLSQAGLLQPLDQETLNQVEMRFRDKEGLWIGTSGRVRVLVYNPTRVKESDLPSRLQDLTDAKWKNKLGWAPNNASFQAHVNALTHLWGEQKTEQWLKSVKTSNPTNYPNNAAQVKAVASGEITLGWVNHYYLHQLKQQDPKLNAINYHFTAPQDAGNLLMIAGAGVHKSSKNVAEAKKLVDYLVRNPAQTYFAQKTFEYPTHPGIPTHKDVTPLNKLNLVSVKQSWLADVGPTVDMLQKLGIL
ncbi:MAG: extracellular solute-binding protein [Gammaproteobacteria bacterium]